MQNTVSEALIFFRSSMAEVTWLWFYLQLAFVIFAAGFGAVVSIWVKRKLDLVSLTMGWPATFRFTARALIESLGVIAFIVLAATIQAVMSSLTWPSRSYMLGVAVDLALAWLVIRLLASQIKNRLAFYVVAASAWIIAALSIFGVLDNAIAFLDAMAINFGELRLSVLLVLKTIGLLVITLWMATAVGNYLEKYVRNTKDLTPSLQVLVAKLVKLFLYTLATVIVLNSVGINLSSLALFSGAIGVGLGFGLQKIVSNFVSGIILLADKSIKPGDVISVGESFGWVDTMGARYSSVVTRDGREFLIPNEDLVTQRVINWSHSNDRIRVDVPFGVSYSSDPHVVRKIAVEAVANISRVLKTPAPVCHVSKFADSSIDFLLRIWIRDPIEGVTNVRGAVLLELWDAFKSAGIQIPYQVRDLRATEPLHIVVDNVGDGRPL